MTWSDMRLATPGHVRYDVKGVVSPGLQVINDVAGGIVTDNNLVTLVNLDLLGHVKT